MNEQETIHKTIGEWRNVKKMSDVYIGQRIRYFNQAHRFGFSDCDKYGDRHRFVENDTFKILHGWNIQAFFPLPVKIKRKVAKVLFYSYADGTSWFETKIITRMISANYDSRKSAIRGARRFCKAIGYECEIQK